MHTPLDSHLHTADCNKIIEELVKCQEKNGKVKMMFGACDAEYHAMRDFRFDASRK